MIDFKRTRRTISAIKSKLSDMETLQLDHKISKNKLFQFAISRFNEAIDLAIEFHRGIPKDELPSQVVSDKIAEFVSAVSAQSTSQKAIRVPSVRKSEQIERIKQFLLENPQGVTRKQICNHLGLTQFSPLIMKKVRSVAVETRNPAYNGIGMIPFIYKSK